MSRPVRYDRHGRPEYAPSEATKNALAILAGAADKRDAERMEKLKARQEAGELNVNDRLLSAIFGEIK